MTREYARRKLFSDRVLPFGLRHANMLLTTDHTAPRADGRCKEREMNLAAAKLQSKIEAQSTDTLKDMAMKLMADMRDGAEIVLSAVLDVLMVRLPEDQFVALCEKLEG
jgi:hypothetical protein